jgi:N-acetylmuramoyl-L-alanine amidase
VPVTVLLAVAAVVCGLWGFHGVLRAAALRAALAGLRGRIIVVDPGHGGIDPGAVGLMGTREDLLVAEVSRQLAVQLAHEGAIVIATRDGTPAAAPERSVVNLQVRQELINGSGADVFVSIHANKYHLASAHGAQVLYNPHDPGSRRLAELIQAELRAITGETRREAMPRPDLFLLNGGHIRIPGVIVEVGFLSNRRDVELLLNPEYQRRVTWAVVLGLAHYFAGASAAGAAPPVPPADRQGHLPPPAN